MPTAHKAILKKGNAAISVGNYEGFLAYCTEDTEWEFVGERILKGKHAVRQYMATAYIEPPRFTLNQLIAEGNLLTAVGEIELKGKDGKWTSYAYCDVWRFDAGKLAALKAFVLPLATTGG